MQGRGTVAAGPGERGGVLARHGLTASGLALLLTLSHVAVDGIAAILSVLLPTLQARFGLSESWLALLVAVLWFSSSMSQPLFGLLADRLNARIIAGAGVMLIGTLISLIGVAPTVTAVVGLLFAGGLGSGAFHPAGAALAREVWPANPGLTISVFSAGGAAGFAVGPVAVLLIVSSLGLSATAWLMLPVVALGLAVLGIFRSPPPRRTAFSLRHLPMLLKGPVGLLTVVVALSTIPSVTFASAMPLWLVNERGLATDAPLLGWTLAAFNLAAALSGVAATSISTRVTRRWLIPGTMVASLVPLFAAFTIPPGSASFFGAVLAAGALTGAALPLIVITAQDLAAYAMATAAGLIGFALGLAGVMYAGVGALQQQIGLGPAMGLAYTATIPAALLAAVVLRRHASVGGVTQRGVVSTQCLCSPCLCGSCPFSLIAGHPWQ